MDVSPGRVSVNGAELAYIEQGEGDLIAFVHGSLNDLRSWDGQRAALADGYRAVACSRRYHWPNAAPCAGDLYAIATHTADLAALIEALGPGPAHLVGSSYGAMTVLTLTAARPELARTLVLGEPPLLPWLTTTPDGTALFEAFMAEAWEPAGEAQKRGDTDAMVRLFVDGVIGPGTFEHLPPPARSSMLDNAPELALELQTPPETYFPRLTPDDLRRLRVPALLLTGERSPHMFHRIQDQLATQLPDIERATIPDASHTMHLANPGAYTEMVRDFLARH